MSVGDNYIPFVAQILLDAVLDPHYLHLPRVLLINHYPAESGIVPHMALFHDLATGGTLTEAEVCYTFISLLVHI
jgi:hypothetical protein